MNSFTHSFAPSPEVVTELEQLAMVQHETTAQACAEQNLDLTHTSRGVASAYDAAASFLTIAKDLITHEDAVDWALDALNRAITAKGRVKEEKAALYWDGKIFGLKDVLCVLNRHAPKPETEAVTI